MKYWLRERCCVKQQSLGDVILEEGWIDYAEARAVVETFPTTWPSLLLSDSSIYQLANTLRVDI